MGLKKLFLITVLAGAMSVLGCGDDETGGTGNTGGDGATGGSGGTAATGGSGGGGNGGPASTCEAFCAGTCVLEILDTELDGNDPECVDNCAALQPSFADDDCGDEMQAYLDCAGPGPDCPPLGCAEQFNAWDFCAQGS